jgi:hypothetical protein
MVFILQGNGSVYIGSVHLGQPLPKYIFLGQGD